MADIPIKPSDIESLAQQLEAVDGVKERALLAAIVALASKAIKHGPDDEAEPHVVHETDLAAPVVIEFDPTFTGFGEQIDQAFSPGDIMEAQPSTLRVMVGHNPIRKVRIGPAQAPDD